MSNYPFTGLSRRKKRSVHNEMSRAIKRIQQGSKRIVNFYGRNLVNGIRKLIISGKDITASVEKLIADSLEDIDNRLNKLPQEDSEEDFEEEDDDSGNNILVDYCFGEIYGPNYGIRTLLEFHKQIKLFVRIYL